MRLFLLIALVGGTSGIAGCRSRPAYRAPSFADPRANLAALIEDGERGIAPEDEALWRCEVGMAALLTGDEAAAFSAFHAASRIMGTLESSNKEALRAILGQETTKRWKGDPHERCMNALYKGLLYWRRGDLDNASACFKTGLLADAYSEAGEHQRDFAALSFLLGWISHARGKTEQARFSFKEAAEHAPKHRIFDNPRPQTRNVLIVAGIGPGPQKFGEGPIARFARLPSVAGGLAVLVDGVPRGHTAHATDLFDQATTRGKKKIDGIRKGKAVFKDAAAIGGWIVLDEGLRRREGGLIAVGAGLLALSALTRPEADIRHWASLPGAIHLAPLRITPGRHRITLHVLDVQGVPVPGWERTIETDVPANRSLVFYFQTGKNHAIHGPASATATPESSR